MTLLVVQGCVIGIGTVLFWVLPELVRRAPKPILSLPNKEYWLSPERREKATIKFAVWGDTVGTAVNMLMTTLQLVLAGNADEARAMPTRVPAVVLGGFLLFTLCSIIWLALAYRIPTRTE